MLTGRLDISVGHMLGATSSQRGQEASRGNSLLAVCLNHVGNQKIKFLLIFERKKKKMTLKTVFQVQRQSSLHSRKLGSHSPPCTPGS